MSLPPFAYHAPTDSRALYALLAELGPRARILAGGTDLINWMAQGLVKPEAVIDVNALPELGGIAPQPDGGLSIGAAVRIEDLEKSALVRERYHALWQGAREIGSPQIRAMATIGGNCCNASPCADTPPPLVVLGARVVLAGPKGRREMLLEEFIRGNRLTAIAPDEVLERFLLPPPGERSASRFTAIGLRAAQEIDIASVAVNLALAPDGRRVAAVRIALGAVAPVPMRAPGAEALLVGAELTEERIAQAAASCAAECRPIDDLRASAEYRRYVVQTLAARTLKEAAQAARAGA